MDIFSFRSKVLFVFMRIHSSIVVFKKLFSFTIAGRRAGPGSVNSGHGSKDPDKSLPDPEYDWTVDRLNRTILIKCLSQFFSQPTKFRTRNQISSLTENLSA